MGCKMVNINKIKTLAKSKGITLSFICEKLNLHRSYLNIVERNKTDISIDRLEIIADILDTTVEYLRDETDFKEKPSFTTDEELNDLIKAIESLKGKKRAKFLQLCNLYLDAIDNDERK